MILQIAKKEFLASIKTTHFLAVFLLCIVLIPAATYVVVLDYEGSIAIHKLFQAFFQKDEVGTNPIGVRVPEAHDQASLESGRSESIGPSQLEKSVGDRQAPRGITVGRVAFLFVVSIILSMLAYALSATTILAQKLNGELRYTLAATVSRSQVLLGKLTGNYAALVLPLFAGLLLAVSVAAFSPAATSALGGSTSFILALVFLSLLFLLSQLTLGLYITVGSKSTASAAVRLVLIWAVFSLVIPRMAPLVAEFVYPTRPASLVTFEKQAAKRKTQEQMIKRLSLASDSEQVRLAVLEYEARLQEEYRRIEKEDSLAAARQTALSREFSMYSPVSCYEALVSEISSAGIGVNIDHLTPGIQVANVWGILADQWPFIAILALFVVLFLITSFQKFKKYDVR